MEHKVETLIKYIYTVYISVKHEYVPQQSAYANEKKENAGRTEL